MIAKVDYLWPRQPVVCCDSERVFYLVSLDSGGIRRLGTSWFSSSIPLTGLGSEFAHCVLQFLSRIHGHVKVVKV